MSARQALYVVAAVVIALVVYVVAVRRFQHDAKLNQYAYSVGAPPADRLEVTAQIVSVSPLKDSLRVRFGFKPFGKYAADEFGRLATAMTVVVTTVDGYQPVQLAAARIPVAINKDIELGDGSPNDYPFDRYTARTGISVFARATPNGASTKVATVVRYEENLGNYAIVPALGTESTRAAVDVRLQIRRSAAIITFSSMMYAAMVLVSTSVVILTVLVVVRRIDPDFSMMLWSAAMLFALPAVRNSLPDSPPLGSQSDFYVFMWAEFA
ncbi:MAG TPA: DUF4436 family protein, partial [Dongiaceae bacterium]|nr:DUF4436 family protein [Dongiaceae bacterium]